MYATTSHKTFAADARTCAVIWSHSYTTVGPEHITSNRGVALYRGTVYRGTTDGHLLALDANTGKVKWDIEVADPNSGYFISAAPLVFEGKIYVGEGGADHGIKGHIHAIDGSSGKEVWKFDVIPTGDEPGADTWSAGQETGGGSSWSSMAVDTTRRLLFVPTGNPGPDFNPVNRRGTNLYTDSVVVLDADTGKLACYVRGHVFFGGLLTPGRKEKPSGSLRGIDAASGEPRWVYHSPTVLVAGVTATAGGLLLTGDGAGNFLVLATRTGKILYRFQTGGGVAGGISTYSVEGEQLIAVPSGNSSR